MCTELKRVLKSDDWSVKSCGQKSDGSFLTILYNSKKMVKVKFSDTGYFVTCEECEFAEGNWETADILSNFTGHHLVRIAKHKEL